MDIKPLKPFQEDGFQHITTRVEHPGRAMVLVDMGLGKTPITCKAACHFNCKRILVICGDNAVDVWRRDGRQNGDWGAVAWIHQWMTEKLGLNWSGAVKVHLMDEEVWNREVEWATLTPDGEIHLYICVYNTFSNDMGIVAKPKKGKKPRKPPPYICRPPQGFDMVVVDEARRMRNRNSALFRAVDQLSHRTNFKYFMALTGTPTTKGPQDLWTMFKIIDRKKFSSYWTYVEYFCETAQDPWGGKEILGPRQRNMPEFHEVLKRHAIVIKEDDPGISEYRPPLTRQQLPIKMDEVQKKMYRDFYREMYVILKDGGISVAQNSMVQLLRLRQILICPQLIDPVSSPGQAIRDFAQNIEDGIFPRPSVIFTPFTSAFPWFRSYLTQKLDLSNDDIIQLESGIGADEQSRRIERWRKREGIALVSIMYALAFSLEPATKAFFIGYDYDPNNNAQAEKRLHRLTTLNPINIYYYTFRNTVDWHIINDILNPKQDYINVTMPSRLKQLMELANERSTAT